MTTYYLAPWYDTRAAVASSAIRARCASRGVPVTRYGVQGPIGVSAEVALWRIVTEWIYQRTKERRT